MSDEEIRQDQIFRLRMLVDELRDELLNSGFEGLGGFFNQADVDCGLPNEKCICNKGCKE